MTSRDSGSSFEHDSSVSLPMSIPMRKRPLGHQRRQRAHTTPAAAPNDDFDYHGYPLATSMSQMSVSPRPPARLSELFVPDFPDLFLGDPIKTQEIVVTSVTEVLDGAGGFSKSPAVFAQMYFSDSPPSRPPSSTGSHTSSTFEWHPANLLTLSDTVRTTIRESGINTISSIDLARLDAMLEKFLLDELLPKSVELQIIVQGRVDKLLGALCDGTKVDLPPSQLRNVIEKACALQRSWKARFGIKYKCIDEDRLTSLRYEGFLHKMLLAHESGDQTTAGKSSPNLHLEIGKWWPSLQHVYCDRVVKSLDEVVTPGANGVFWVLPMLTGTEEDGPTTGTYKFMREGSERDMHNALMVTASKKIRVLRGHTLKSKYAPTAGIRYDGEYTVERYCRPPAQNPRVQKLALILQRVDGQISVNDIRNIPTPCQIDDWNLYYKDMDGKHELRREDEVCSRWARDVEEKSSGVIV